MGANDKLAATGYESTMTFELDAHAGAEMVEMLFGLDPRQYPKPKPEPTHSIYMTTMETVSGEPEKPKHVRGFWAWLKGTNRKNHEQYVRERLRWIADGKPTKQVEVGIYIPKARLTHVDPA